MKACAMSRGHATCADCGDFADFKECKKLYNLVSRFFGFIFHTDRIANLNRIKRIGLDAFRKEKMLDHRP